MLLTLLALTSAFSPLPKLHVVGPNLVDPAGKIVALRGCNLGNWFMIEHWMWDEAQGPDSSHDQFELESILSKRFGAGEKDRLMELYRSSWITDRDFDIIKSFRFNCVRIPLNYRMFEDDSHPLKLRPDCWKWTDRAVEMCAKHGIYAILDMHGVQGGQSKEDHTGKAGQNLLWTTPGDQDRLAWLWSKVAAHYRNRSAVVAYDVINEPYGGQKAQIRAVFNQVYAAIRPVDPEKLIYAMGHYSGFDMYGDPKANGWHNVGIEMHYYPGLFGNGSPTVSTQVRHLRSMDKALAPKVAALNVPFFVGEFNVVFNSAGNPDMMRRTYDCYESHGWATTMWSYKVLGRKGGFADASWGMVSNRYPLPKLDFATAPESDIESFFASQATMPYSTFQGLRQVLAPTHVHLKPLPEEKVRTTAPHGTLPGWNPADIGGSMTGGLAITTTGFDLFGGGSDIWGEQDQFRFLNKKLGGDFELTVTVNKVENLGPYAKAGLMIRDSLNPNSAFVMLSVFPSGEVQTAVRGQMGAGAEGTTAVQVGFPLTMKIERKGAKLSCYFRKGDRDPWIEKALPSQLSLGSNVFAGPIALSHDEGQLIKVSYSNLGLLGN